jgi:hypothetical protein
MSNKRNSDTLYAETTPMEPKIRSTLRDCEADFMRDKGVMDWDNAVQIMPGHYRSYCAMQGLILEARVVVRSLHDVHVVVVKNDTPLWSWHRAGRRTVKENLFLDIVDS